MAVIANRKATGDEAVHATQMIRGVLPEYEEV